MGEMIAPSLLTYFATVAYACLQASSVTTSSRAAAANGVSSASNALDNSRAVSLDAACDIFGQYSAVEILQRLEINSAPEKARAAVTDGGRVSCTFDPNEFCSWYSVPPGDSELSFNRAHFDMPLDAARFRCTTGRELIPDGHFLLAGSPDGVTDLATTAIETRIPCQLGPARLLFDYWATSRRPSLRACVISNASGALNCQGPLADDLSPQIIVQVPQNFEPFILRIEVNDMQRADLVIIDSILYEGQLCELVPDETSSALPNEQTTEQLDTSEREPMSDLPNQCKAVECDFNDGDACLYNTEGLGGSDPWQVGEGRLGNRLTGVQRRNDNDPIGGYAYVGWTGRDASNSIFVLDSPEFTLSEPTALLFDLYQRSVGPLLKVCIDDFDNCPYESPPLDRHKFWHLDQEVALKEGLRKYSRTRISAQNANQLLEYTPPHKEATQFCVIYFVVTGVGANLYIAIDNVRLKPGALSGSADICTINK